MPVFKETLGKTQDVFRQNRNRLAHKTLLDSERRFFYSLRHKNFCVKKIKCLKNILDFYARSMYNYIDIS